MVAQAEVDRLTAQFQAAAELRACLREFSQSSERVLTAHGLTPERYELLLAIKGAPDGSERSTVSQLADVLGVAQSSVTQLVRRAEDAGLLRREVSGSDARVRYLRLTANGERRLTAAVTELGPERERLAGMCGRLTAPTRPAAWPDGHSPPERRAAAG